jgi:hypothetical protein
MEGRSLGLEGGGEREGAAEGEEERERRIRRCEARAWSWFR